MREVLTRLVRDNATESRAVLVSAMVSLLMDEFPSMAQSDALIVAVKIVDNS